jgi:hypothetical protein
LIIPDPPSARFDFRDIDAIKASKKFHELEDGSEKSAEPLQQKKVSPVPAAPSRGRRESGGKDEIWCGPMSG